jgi:signal transduction histidine kinase
MSSLRNKLWIGFSSLLAILVIVSLLSVVVLTSYSHTLEQVFRENYNSAVYCDAMKNAMERLNLRAQLLIWDEPSAAQIDAQSETAAFDRNLALQLNNCTLPGELDHTRGLSQQWDQYRGAYQRLEKMPADARREFYRSALLPQHQEIQQTAQWIADKNMSNMVSVDGQVKKTLGNVRSALLLLVVLGTLAAATVVGAAGASILHPLRMLTASARQIEKGNLDLLLHVRGDDEIAQLSAAFNSMAERLREFRQLDHDRLARTQLTTQLAIDSLPDAVFIIGPDGSVEISNRSAGVLFGIVPGAAADELRAKHKWFGPLYHSAREGGPAPEERGYRSAVQLFDAGQERFLLPRAVAMSGAGGRTTGVCFILVDVTRLHAADEAKSGVISTVSHELRTPLTSIRMALGLLVSGKFGAPGEKQAALLAAAREDSDRLNRIIENVMSMSRIESGRAQFQFQQMSPLEIASQAADPMRSAFAERGIQLDVDVPENLPPVMADAVAIRSAVTNLLTNSLKFTPTGGHVRLAGEFKNDRVSLTVTDSGPGIPDQYAAQVFEKFFRVPRKEGPTGAGLGLAIAREVVEAHGGTIQLCSDYRPGARFRISLPAVGIVFAN